MQAARKVVRLLEGARELRPVVEAAIEVGEEPLWDVGLRHAQHRGVVDGARVEQRPLRAAEKRGVEQVCVLFVLREGACELMAVEGHEDVSHVEDDVPEQCHADPRSQGAVTAIVRHAPRLGLARRPPSRTISAMLHVPPAELVGFL